MKTARPSGPTPPLVVQSPGRPHPGLPPLTLSAQYLGRAVRAAVERGARRPRLLDAIGTDEPSLSHPTRRLPVDAMLRMIDAAIGDTGNPCFAIEMAPDFAPRDFSEIGYAAYFCQTLGHSLDLMLDRQPYNQTIVRFDAQQAGTDLTLSLDTAGQEPERIARFVELLSVATFTAIERMAGRMLRPREIAFAHRQTETAAALTRIFRVAPRFDARDSHAIFDPLILTLPIRSANPQLLDALERRWQRAAELLGVEDHPAALCALFARTEMGRGPVSLERAARVLGTTERSLRRHLSVSRWRFRDIVENARREMSALYLMEGRRSIGEIALLLGYSDISAYTRAHTGWYGQPPSRADHLLRAAG